MTYTPEEQEYNKSFDGSLWAKMFRYAKPFHGKMRDVAICMGIVALCDAVFPQMTRYAIDRFIAAGDLGGLLPFTALYFALVCVQVVSTYRFIYLAGRVENGICFEMRRLGFRKLQELPFSYYDRMPVGYLMSRMTSDTRHLGEAFGWGLVELVWSGVYLLASLLSMFFIQWKLTLGVMLTLPVLAAASLYFQKRILSGHREVRKMNSRITEAVSEGILGAKTTKTLSLEEFNREDFFRRTEDMKRLSVSVASLSSLFLPVVISIGSIATAFALARGSGLVLAGALSLGSLTAFIGYTIQFFQPIRDLAGLFSEMQRTQASAERVVALLETEPEIVDTPDVEKIFGDNFTPHVENWPPIAGEVTFEHVSFKYRDGETVLRDFNLHVRAGETIALVGPTGAGKSTIVNLVCRFYEPTEGRILIDGVDYRQRSQLWLQSNLGYVLQEPHLFSGSVADNIRYGKENASDGEVERAAGLVSADAFISRLEKGYGTQVGEGGNRLSTGEKQLISFARAILKDPRILILDEATSSVDAETEAGIQKAVERTVLGRTSFIIAHRLSTIRSAGRILVIDDGRVVESGTHGELMRSKGAYYQLYTNQFREERSRFVLSEKQPAP